MESAFNQVVASYHRARSSGQFFDTFYELFLSKSPEIPAMFVRTDFPHQKLMLRESILEMLVFAQTGSGRDELLRLAARHRQLNVKPIHYDLWLEALCEALRRHDSQFSPTLEGQWRDALQKGMQLFTSDNPEKAT